MTAVIQTTPNEINFLGDEHNNGFKVRYNNEDRRIDTIGLVSGTTGKSRKASSKILVNLQTNHPRISLTFSKFVGLRKKTLGCDWKTAIQIILVLPGLRAGKMKLKMSKCIAKHFMPQNWTTKQKVDRLNEMFKTLPPPEEVEGLEFEVVKRIQSQIGGEREVACSNGFIDLLTSDLIIEVKKCNMWKHALGQILVYGIDYPNHQKKLFLFDVNDNSKCENVRKLCDMYNVEVDFIK